MSDAAKYAEIFDYLSAPSLPASQEPAIVFGRNDPVVAHKLGDLAIPGLVEVAVITGGIGKDTGDLLKRGYRSEAHFLQDVAEQDAVNRDYQLPTILLDEKAANGAENARNGLSILTALNPEISSLTTVLHATSARRLAETVKFEAQKADIKLDGVHVAPSDYNFNPESTTDRAEAASELLRLADWPEKGLLGAQLDLPKNLVDFTRETYGESPKPVSSWQSDVLRILPKSLRVRVINFAADHGRK